MRKDLQMTIKYHHDLEQGTDLWHDVRRGILTGSNISDMLTPKLKQADNEKTKTIIYQAVIDRVHNWNEDPFYSFAMQRGHVEEIYAKDMYSKHYAQVKDCGFIENDNLGFRIGCSPDGLVGNDGGVECKSRNQAIQAKVIINNAIPEDDMLQVQMSLFVSGRDWWDYISYSNGLPMFVKRAEPIKEYFDAIKIAANAFEEKVNQHIEIYKANIENLYCAVRRDFDTGEAIKPSL